jgi:hypothetical protein
MCGQDELAPPAEALSQVKLFGRLGDDSAYDETEYRAFK